MHKTISNVFFLRNYSHFHSNICSWGCSWWFVSTGSGKRLCASLARKIMACCLTAWAISWTNFDWRLLISFPGQFLRKHPKYVDKNVYSKTFMNIFASSRGVWGDKAFTHLSLVPHICISESGQHWFRQWLIAYFAPSHHLNQCWVIVN